MVRGQPGRIHVQTVAIAQSHPAIPAIVVELRRLFQHRLDGVASSIYQRAGLGGVRLHELASQGSTARRRLLSGAIRSGQADEQPRLAKYAADLGLKKLAVLYLNTDWGRTEPESLLRGRQGQQGAEIVASEGYQPEAEKDFRSTLVRVRDAKPDGIILISYCRGRRLDLAPDPHCGADDADCRERFDLFAEVHRIGRRRRRQRRLHREQFLSGRHATRGGGLRFEVQSEIQRRARRLQRRWLTTRSSCSPRSSTNTVPIAPRFAHGLAEIKDVPSVIYGKATFDPQTRASQAPAPVHSVVKDGKFRLARTVLEAPRRPLTGRSPSSWGRRWRHRASKRRPSTTGCGAG